MKKLSTLLILFSLLGSNALFGQAVTDYLVGYYNMDEGEGTTLTNGATGSLMPNGIIINPVWSDVAKFGKCLHFDLAANNPDEGVSYVDFGRYDPTEGYNTLTFACWLNWNGVDGEYHGITGKRDNWYYDSVHWDFTLSRQGMFKFEALAAGDVNNYLISTETPVVGEWEHVAVTYDGATAILYVNGEKVVEERIEFGAKTDALFMLGCTEPYGVTPFQGLLDEVYYFSRALKASEIADIYNYVPPATDVKIIKLGLGSVYPNPMGNELNMDVEGMQSVKLFDIRGKLVLVQDVFGNKAKLNTSGLSPGVYFIHATGKENHIAKIIKN
ncbi:MAG: T9SS C-terminal target domain-containing protein [Alphaproteobacteria bacterium]|nr:MAG: T9SS C-terminal target domain-containing protein [Alphaproteobacteria bacterium]